MQRTCPTLPRAAGAGALAILALVAIAGPAPARNAGGGDWFSETAIAGAYQPGASFKGEKGSVSSGASFLKITVGHDFGERNRIALSLGAGITFYDFDGRTGARPEWPWQRIRELRLDLPISLAVTDTVTAYVSPGIRWNAENGAEFNGGRTEGVRAGFSYRFSDSFLIGPGFGWFTDLDGGSSFYPILIVDWDVTDRLNVSTARGLAASRGPGITVSYRIDEAFRVGISGRVENRSFRLDDDGPAPNGIGGDRGVPLVAILDYAPAPAWSVTAFAGLKFGGELTLDDADGDRLAESDYEAVPIFGLSLRARF